MQFYISGASPKKMKICHKEGCMYLNRIKSENIFTITPAQAEQLHCYECRYCGGLIGDVRVHKPDFEKRRQEDGVCCTYDSKSDTLYIGTEIGFWKIYSQKGTTQYLLFHRNKYHKNMSFGEAICGEFHRQKDCKPTMSLNKLLNYITRHDQAKEIIKEDYRNLPQKTKKQKKYYRQAQKKAARRAENRVDQILSNIDNLSHDWKIY